MIDQHESQNGEPDEGGSAEGRRERVLEDAREHFRGLPEWRREQAIREADAVRLGHEQTMKR
jgi:hypothetical protein